MAQTKRTNCQYGVFLLLNPSNCGIKEAYQIILGLYLGRTNHGKMKRKAEISWEDFEKIDIRTGTVVDAIPFEKAKKPAFKVYVDFGELGILKTSAQLTENYSTEELIGSQIVAVVNFPNKQIADFMSECLILGAYSAQGTILLTTERKAKSGLKIG